MQALEDTISEPPTKKQRKEEEIEILFKSDQMPKFKPRSLRSTATVKPEPFTLNCRQCNHKSQGASLNEARQKLENHMSAKHIHYICRNGEWTKYYRK